MAVFVFAIATTVFADINVTLDGQQVEFDVPPQIVDGRTLVPLRGIFYALGAEFDWDGDTRTVTATKDGIVVVMQIDNPVITVAGQNITLDVPPQIIDDRTLVPARAVAEGFGVDADWCDDTRTVLLTTNNPGLPVESPEYLKLSDLQDIQNFWIEVNGVRYTLGQPLNVIAADIPVSEMQQHLLEEYLPANTTASITLQARDAGNQLRSISLALINFSNEGVLYADVPVMAFNVSRRSGTSESFEVTFINDIRFGETTRADVEAMFGEPHVVNEMSASVSVTFQPFDNPLSAAFRDSSVYYRFVFDLETGTLETVAIGFRRA